MSITIHAIDHLVLNVSDVKRSAEWYNRVVGTEVRTYTGDGGQTTRTSLHFGQQKINLRPIDIGKDEWFTADHEQVGSDDICFLTTASPEAVIAHLAACGVTAEVGPVSREGARGTLRSIYCRDPDGSLIEIASYESDAP